MKKTYKTTFKVEAEQFDGSLEMAERYQMVMSPVGVYHVNAFDGIKAIREGDWLISNGEDIAIADDEYFEEHYELVEDDDPIDKLTKVIEERKAQPFDAATYIAQLALEVAGMNNKLEQIQDILRTQQEIRQNEAAEKSRAYINFVDELTDVLINNKLM